MRDLKAESYNGRSLHFTRIANGTELYVDDEFYGVFKTKKHAFETFKQREDENINFDKAMM